ncbi:isocitrate lyase/phosphoenolpyruvate mutase family protein [Spirillospora sp. NPDC127200]
MSKHKAHLLQTYHATGELLVLPNAWDALSAALMARAGAKAVATTSAGVAWAMGFQDGSLARTRSARLDRSQMVEAIGRIADVVDVPVTADIEDGYGPALHDVATTVEQVIAAGAVGINLEDTTHAHDAVLDVDACTARLRAARDAAAAAGLPELVINARTDVFLVGRRDLAEVVERGNAYAEAGADCLFVPGLLDLSALASLAEAVPLPINAMAVPSGPTIAQLAAAGVRRVSVGSAVQQAAYAAAATAAAELLESGTYGTFAGALGIREINSLLPGRRS